MCAAIDMLSSEQMFYGHSPPASFLNDYTVRRPTKPKMTTRGFSAPCLPSISLKPLQITLQSAPRSCIRMPTENKKKRVVFADDRGYALEQVKFMTEPSYLPPYWALKIVTKPTPQSKPATAPDLWEIRFVQPASNYIEFRRKITEECVSLENVIVKQSLGAVDGTVKVKNLDFVKEVFVRTSSDGWSSHEDSYCAFLDSGPLNPQGVSAYDTFGFRIQLPIHSRKLEFCAGFRCQEAEYWDNNNGLNYVIEKSSVRNPPAVSCARINYGNAWNAKADLNGNTPYW